MGLFSKLFAPPTLLGNGRIRGHDLLTMQGWGQRFGDTNSHGMNLREGDIMVLLRKEGHYTVRVITSVRTCRDPPDMQFHSHRSIHGVEAMKDDPRAQEVQEMADCLLQRREEFLAKREPEPSTETERVR